MSDSSQILKLVLEKINPKESERKKSNYMFLEIQSFIREKFSIQADLMGSLAKDTFLAGDKDLDIFIFFGQNVARETLERKGLEIGKAVFQKFKSKNYQISYAEHPYTKGVINSFRIEIVPAYEVERAELLQSAVDRTPFHKAFVNEHLKNTDAVRLLKKFLKANGCYGSDLKTGGFSGYLCELLAIKYGSFENILAASQYWHYQEVLDVNDHFQTQDEKLAGKRHDFSKHEYARLRKKFENQPLIFLDPTDKNRNVAAVLSHKKIAAFVFKARKFLKSPSISYFFKPEEKINTKKFALHQKEKGTDLVIVIFKKPLAIDDILYPQLRKFSSGMAKTMTSEGFDIVDVWEFADVECGIAVELLSKNLPKYLSVRGPSVFNPAEHQDRFVSKYKKVWLEGTFLTAETAREHIDAIGFFQKHLKNSAKKLHDAGVPSTIAESVSKGFKVFEFKKAGKIKSREFWRGLQKDLLR
ncbi:MAG: CCA tRNA nucleotidyltransferase [Nanoarchaeota archaeon]|nr:CCA tRNA nucleotidyltransferase [Nanoarchaeota archaeon]MBU4300158.1 CCA tRNA nucleotidyltransferase [Nanoarchaeota archaeon]MCG2724364.1 CCA tRNA nucleotidyltransferase [archaeon]